jgi:serine/threonine-protein kinase
MSGYPTGIGDYEVRGTLGTGMSGTVFLAHQSIIDRDVALKQLSAELTAQPEFLERFRAEAEIMARLDNDHCVRVFDFFEREGHAYLVSEVVAGVSLRKLVENGALSPEQSLGVLKGGLLGLEHAQELGLVHRDIKPENILLDTEGTSKLADFGLAGAVEGPGASSGMPSGSPAYMSPEMVGGALVDARSDLYSAGAVLFELLTGRPPFVADGPLAVMRMHRQAPVPNPHDLNGQLGPEVSGLVMGSLAKDPADRPQTAAQMLAALEVAATQAYGPEWESRSSVKREVAAAIGAGLGLLAMLGPAAAFAAAAAVGSAVTASAAGSSAVQGVSTWLVAAAIAGVLIIGAGGFALAHGAFSGAHTGGAAVVVATPSATPTELLSPSPDASPSPTDSPTPTPSAETSPSSSPSGAAPQTTAKKTTTTPTTSTTTSTGPPPPPPPIGGPVTITGARFMDYEVCNGSGAACTAPKDASPYFSGPGLHLTAATGTACATHSIRLLEKYTYNYAAPAGSGVPIRAVWRIGTSFNNGDASTIYTAPPSSSPPDATFGSRTHNFTDGPGLLVGLGSTTSSGFESYALQWSNPNGAAGAGSTGPGQFGFYCT